jgi:hypothetical protein
MSEETALTIAEVDSGTVYVPEGADGPPFMKFTAIYHARAILNEQTGAWKALGYTEKYDPETKIRIVGKPIPG